ncbi:MAG: hypothetical protein Q4B32_03550 [Clostridia bacterium]|nr:hypothetical protein [Clostridia bacterium]
MTEYSMTFGKCLDQWMLDHDLSAAEVAAITGTGSTTTISRLRHDQCTPKRCLTFLESLLAAQDAPVSPQEETRFRASLNVNRMQSGPVDHEEAFHRIFFPAAGSRTDLLLRQLQPLLEDALEIHVLTFQHSSTVLFQDLMSLLDTFGDRMHVQCCLHMVQSEEMPGFIADAMPVLCDTRCRVSMLPEHASSPGDLSILRCRKRDAWQEWLLLAQPSKKIRMMSLPDGGLYDFFQQVAVDAKDLNYVYDLSDFRSCAEHLEALYQMEKDTETCIMQEDLPFACMPIDILHAAFRSEREDHGTMVDLRRISYLRCTNMLTKKRATHLLMSCRGVENFMATGQLKRKVMELRPFTVEERKSILSALIAYAEQNEHFDLHLSGEDQLFVSHNVSANLGHGVALMPGSYEGYLHCDTFVHDAGFARSLRRYFCKTLIPCYAMSKEDSIAFLKHLVGDQNTGEKQST